MSIITSEEFVLFQGVQGLNTTLLQSLIDSAEARVLNFLGYDPNIIDYDIAMDGNNSSVLIVDAPIISLTSISIDGIIQDINGFVFTNNIIEFKDNKKYFKKGIKNISIVYSGGFEAIPEDIKLVVKQITSINLRGTGGNFELQSINDPNIGQRVYSRFDIENCLKNISQYKSRIF